MRSNRPPDDEHGDPAPRWNRWRRSLAAAAVALTAGLAAAACGGSRGSAPVAGESSGAVPDLRGRTVMVFPVQSVQGLPGDTDAELAFALQARDLPVEWVLPADLRAAVQSSPSLDVRLEGLPVGVFMQAEVERVGDPLFGVVRRLGGLTGGEVALIPVYVRYRPGSDAQEGAAEAAAALIDVRSGYVLWFGVEGGRRGASGEPAVLASALEALARRLAGR